ncbi:hypothetical protein BDZ97DRAFT_1383930 [Flammula alnicola]|nr:hypothetical protein BDZ97DRAFT_1383930 [Flammula alnicola]
MGLEKTETEVDAEAEAEEQERRRAEDLGVGRPRTPEPTRMGLRDADSYPARASLLGSGPRRSSMTSPLSHVSSSELRGTIKPNGGLVMPPQSEVAVKR